MSAVIRSIKSYFRHAWRGLKHFGAEALSVWFERSILLAAAVIVLSTGGKLVALASAFFVTRLIDVLISYAITRRWIGPPPPKEQYLPRIRLLARVAPLAFTVIFSTIYYQVDVLMLGALADAAQVGIYHAVYRFVDLVLAGARVLVVVFAPVLSIYFVTDRVAFWDSSSRVLALSVSFGILVILVGPFFSDFLVEILLGEMYMAGGNVLAFLLAAAGFSVFAFSLQTILVAANEERGVAVTLGVTAIANIVVNAILIPNYGALGAAWATLLSEVLLLAGLLFFTLRSQMGTAWLKPGALIAGIGAICIILAWTFPQGLLLGIGVYIVAIVLTQIPNIRALLDLLGR